MSSSPALQQASPGHPDKPCGWRKHPSSEEKAMSTRFIRFRPAFKPNGNANSFAVAIGMAAVILSAPAYASTNVLSAFKVVGNITSGSPIVTLSVPAGAYGLTGKIQLDNDNPSNYIVA